MADCRETLERASEVSSIAQEKARNPRLGNGRSLDEFLGWAKQELRPVMRRMLTICEQQDILRPQSAYGYWKAFFCFSHGSLLSLPEVTLISQRSFVADPGI